MDDANTMHKIHQQSLQNNKIMDKYLVNPPLLENIQSNIQIDP